LQAGGGVALEGAGQRPAEAGLGVGRVEAQGRGAVGQGRVELQAATGRRSPREGLPANRRTTLSFLSLVAEGCDRRGKESGHARRSSCAGRTGGCRGSAARAMADGERKS